MGNENMTALSDMFMQRGFVTVKSEALALAFFSKFKKEISEGQLLWERTPRVFLFYKQGLKEEAFKAAGIRAEEPPEAPKPLEVTEEVRQLAGRYAEDISKFEILSQMIAFEHIGDSATVMTMKLLLHTSKTRDSENIAIKGEASIGKTNLTNAVLRYIPGSWVQKIGRLTANAIYYLKDEGRAILYIQELHLEGNAVHGLKLSSSYDGGFEIGYTARNPKSGEMEVRFKQIKARSLVSTTTAFELEPELATRTVELNLTNEEETTRLTVLYKALQRKHGIDAPEILGSSVLVEAIRYHTDTLPFTYKVLIPYADAIARILPTKDARIRRDIDKLYAIICEIARFDYPNRLSLKLGDGTDVIVASYTDFGKAWQLFSSGFRDTLSGIDELSRSILEVCKSPEVELTVSGVTRALSRDVSTDTVRRRIDALIRKGYMSEDEDVSKPNRRAFRLLPRAGHIADITAFGNSLQNGDLQSEIRSYFSSILQDCKDANSESFVTAYLDLEKRLAGQEVLVKSTDILPAILQYDPSLSPVIQLCKSLQNAAKLQNAPRVTVDIKNHDRGSSEALTFRGACVKCGGTKLCTTHESHITCLDCLNAMKDRDDLGDEF